MTTQRHNMGLGRATGVGVGAIVGGGILVLTGVAMATTGPSVIVVFALNGLIAFLTAISFAEMSSSFPESGGIYTFAKKVMSVRTAFLIGWIAWFASIVAGVLYVISFTQIALVAIDTGWRALGGLPPPWLNERYAVSGIAITVTSLYTLSLCRRGSGGAQWPNIIKVVVYAILIGGGIWATLQQDWLTISAPMRPFFSGGVVGLVQAMGFTFIAFQGFELIAAVGGEVRQPTRTIPRAMFLSLGIALGIYLPLLVILVAVGFAPGQSITEICRENPETIVAIAAANYLGPIGHWLVIVAALCSMLSALEANLFAASHIAQTMARDRTLPRQLELKHKQYGTPTVALVATASLMVVILLLLSDVATAGAASSLIFLVTFALAHGISMLVRRRSGASKKTFRAPWFPLIPVTGALACAALAVFQGIVVPMAGVIASIWLALGGILYFSLFARHARVVDASAVAMNPQLVHLRGKSPLVLAPISNPARTEAMVAVANALAPPDVGRVLLLSIVSSPTSPPPENNPNMLIETQSVLRQAMSASFNLGLFPEALMTVAHDPWKEIKRVAEAHHCESLLLGLSNLTEGVESVPLDNLLGTLDCDVVVLHSPPNWRLSQVKRVLVPVGGRRGHNELRARLLGSLLRTGARQVTYLRVLPENASAKACDTARRELARLAREELPGHSTLNVIQAPSFIQAITQQATQYELTILGLQRLSRRKKVFGPVTLHVAQKTQCGIIMISRRG